MEEEARLLDEHLALAALLRAKGVGGATALKLREAFGSWRAALTASADAYLAQKLFLARGALLESLLLCGGFFKCRCLCLCLCGSFGISLRFRLFGFCTLGGYFFSGKSLSYLFCYALGALV